MNLCRIWFFFCFSCYGCTCAYTRILACTLRMFEQILQLENTVHGLTRLWCPVRRPGGAESGSTPAPKPKKNHNVSTVHFPATWSGFFITYFANPWPLVSCVCVSAHFFLLLFPLSLPKLPGLKVPPLPSVSRSSNEALFSVKKAAICREV